MIVNLMRCYVLCFFGLLLGMLCRIAINVRVEGAGEHGRGRTERNKAPSAAPGGAEASERVCGEGRRAGHKRQGKLGASEPGWVWTGLGTAAGHSPGVSSSSGSWPQIPQRGAGCSLGPLAAASSTPGPTSTRRHRHADPHPKKKKKKN